MIPVSMGRGLRNLRPSMFGALAFLAAAAINPATAQDDFQAGLEHFNRGEFAAALSAWRPLAEGGDAKAQTALGSMYFNGNGVAVDKEEGARWLELAARQGHTSAQYALALMLRNGDGVDKDLVRAYAWLRRASENADGRTRETIIKESDALAAELSPDERTAADALAAEWAANGEGPNDN